MTYFSLVVNILTYIFCLKYDFCKIQDRFHPFQSISTRIQKPSGGYRWNKSLKIALFLGFEYSFTQICFQPNTRFTQRQDRCVNLQSLNQLSTALSDFNTVNGMLAFTLQTLPSTIRLKTKHPLCYYLLYVPCVKGFDPVLLRTYFRFFFRYVNLNFLDEHILMLMPRPNTCGD